LNGYLRLSTSTCELAPFVVINRNQIYLKCRDYCRFCIGRIRSADLAYTDQYRLAGLDVSQLKGQGLIP
jgi:hypothetical protein